jgi:hypothetical protein
VGLDAELGAEGKVEVGALGDAEKFFFRKIVLFFRKARSYGISLLCSYWQS